MSRNIRARVRDQPVEHARPSWLLTAAMLSALLLPQTVSASVIIGLQGAEALLIAGDSRTSVMSADGILKTRDDTCKVHVVGGAVFGMAGFARDLATGFRFETVVIDVLRRGPTIETAAHAIVNELEPRVLALLRHLEHTAPKSFAREMSKKAVVDVILGFRQAGGSAMVRILLKPVGGGTLSISSEIRHPCPPPCKTGYLFAAGLTDEDLDKTPPSQAAPTDAPAYARALINSKMADPLVGGPIDMVQLDRNGPMWLARKLHCPDRQ